MALDARAALCSANSSSHMTNERLEHPSQPLSVTVFTSLSTSPSLPPSLVVSPTFRYLLPSQTWRTGRSSEAHATYRRLVPSPPTRPPRRPTVLPQLSPVLGEGEPQRIPRCRLVSITNSLKTGRGN